MAQRPRRPIYSLALVAGLGLWTLAPYGGCSCDNPLGGNATSGAHQIYGGSEAGKVPINLLDDFNDGAASASPTGHWQNAYSGGILTQVWYNGNDPALRINFWGGGTYSQADAFGSRYYSQLDQPGAANIPGAPVLGPTACLQYGCPTCEYGRTSIYSGPTPSCGQQYPFVEHGMYLSPQDSGGDADVEFSGTCPGAGCQSTVSGDNATLSQHGVEFYLAPGYTNQLMVNLVPLYLYDYANAHPCNGDAYIYYQFKVPQTGANSSGTIMIPFSDFKLGTSACTGPGCIPDEGASYMAGTTNVGYLNATKVVGGLTEYAAMIDANGNYTGSLRFMAIQFDPYLNFNSLLKEPYEFNIDNVEFY